VVVFILDLKLQVAYIEKKEINYSKQTVAESHNRSKNNGKNGRLGAPQLPQTWENSNDLILANNTPGDYRQF